jgi:Tol biopolymer transport system component
MTSRRSTAAIVALATTLIVASAGAAPAAFPGRNGLIAFRSDTSEAVSPQLFSIAPSGGGRRNLTRNLYANVGGSWSPDGSKVAGERGRASGHRRGVGR